MTFCPFWPQLTHRRKSSGLIQAGPPCRDVLAETPSTGAIDETGGARNHRSAETAGCGCSHGVEPSVHGHARSREDIGNDHDELYAWMHAIKREDEGGILESRQQEMSWVFKTVKGNTKVHLRWLVICIGRRWLVFITPDQALGWRWMTHGGISIFNCNLVFNICVA